MVSTNERGGKSLLHSVVPTTNRSTLYNPDIRQFMHSFPLCPCCSFAATLHAVFSEGAHSAEAPRDLLVFGMLQAWRRALVTGSVAGAHGPVVSLLNDLT